MKTRFLFYILTLCGVAFCATPLIGQGYRFTPQDEAVYNKVMPLMQTALQQENLTPQLLVFTAAQAMMGTPYVAGTLEQEPEQLTVSLASTDCILFVEACACLAFTAQQPDHSFEAFCRNLQQYRYKDGMVNGYESRIHYTSQWIQQLEGLKRAKEVTQELGGVALEEQFSYMSSHSDDYPLLKGQPQRIEAIAQTESMLNEGSYYYIPKAQVEKALPRILQGDIICFVSKVEGLDISHVALANESYSCINDCCDDKRGCDNGVRAVGFLHASSKGKKVMVDEQSLIAYLNASPNCMGIRVVRFLPL